MKRAPRDPYRDGPPGWVLTVGLIVQVIALAVFFFPNG